jgi:hypothetical protein
MEVLHVGSGGLPTRPTRPGLGAPKARGPARLGSPKVGGPQGSPAQWSPFFLFRLTNAVLRSRFFFIPLIEEMDSPIWGTPLPVTDYHLGLLGLA